MYKRQITDSAKNDKTYKYVYKNGRPLPMYNDILTSFRRRDKVLDVHFYTSDYRTK